MQYFAKDEQRIVPIVADPRFSTEKYRSPWRRDCGRLVHSPSFRRLQGKSQLFPEQETDFFRNRLTHSLEVAQIAKSIAIKLNNDLENDGESYRIEPDIVEFAALAHDLGHPPFGHFGEEVLDKKMINHGGFEGNAQTLRLITRLEKRHSIASTPFGIDKYGKDKRVGLDLTCRSIASVLKYDQEIPVRHTKRKRLLKEGEIERISPIKGYYKSEDEIVKFIKKNICNGKKYQGSFKIIECRIMDINDKLNIHFSAEDVLENIASILQDHFESPHKIKKPITISNDDLSWFHLFSLRFGNEMSKILREDGYYRTNFTSKLVGRAIRSVSIDKINRDIPALSTVKLDEETAIDVEMLKHIVFESQILSPKVQILAYRSEEILGKIFDALSNEEKKGYTLLPNDFRAIYEAVKTPINKKRVICDFVACMTDRYALEFYGRLTSENPQTIFKPF